MKKLLMFLFLMTISLGQSQTLRLGFESGESGNAFGPFGDFAIQPVEAGTGTNTSLVLPIIANPAGQPWQGTNFVLTTPVELIASKTMTIDVLSSVPVTFLMKVNTGTGPEAAAQASHNGDGTWQTISFTFNTSLDGKAATANGVYNNMVLHPFFPFSGASAQTFYIDNISGPAVTPPSANCTNGIQDGDETGVDCGGSCSPCPAFTVAAPTPTQATEDVISVFSNTYTDLAGTDFFPNWGQSTLYSQFSPVVGNPTLKYSNLNYQGNQFAAPIDASAMQNLHIDIWTPDCTSFQVYLISTGPVEQAVTVTPTLSGWNSYDIPLSSYSSVNKADIVQFKYVGSGTVYLDNLYFWKVPAGSYTYYADNDNDGFGAGAASISTSPTAPVGFSANATDCNDANNAIYPGATEIADTFDNDCDGLTDEGFPPTVAAPTPPARNTWDVVSIFSGAYANTTLDELPTGWSQLAIEPFSVESIGGNDTWKFGGEFLGMAKYSGDGVNLTDMTMVHIDYWTPDPNLIILKLVNTVDGGDGTAILEDPTVSGSWRSRDIPLSAFGALNRSKITQLLIDPQSGGSTVYVDNFYFYRPETGAPSPSIGALTVPAKAIGDANFDLTAPSSNSAGAFTYSSSNESVATISGSTVTIVGAGSSIITATQAAAGAYGSGSTTATLVVSLATSAPAPTVPGDRVLSIFSNAAGYANVAGTNFYPNWGQSTQYALESIAGNPTIRYSNLNYEGIQLGSVIDISTYDTVHLNIYGAGTSAVDFRVINQVGGAGSPDVERIANRAITLNPGWNSIEFPVSALTTATPGFELNRVGQLMFVGSGTIYVDDIFFSKAVPTAVAPTVADIAFCKGSVTALTAIPSGTNALRWYTVSTGGTALASAPIPTATKTYYVAQVMSNGTVSTRATLIATVNNLPATPSLLVSTESKNICKYIGSSTPVTFTATASGAASYIWTVPALATIETGNGTSSIGVSFENTTTTAGAIGSVTARAVDANGCASLPKILALTTVVPKAPASLIMTSTDSSAHFNLRDVGSDPATYSFVGLNALTSIKKVGPYMQTGTVFTLTAATASTAASYAWTLPTGVTPIGATNSNVLNVTFDGAALGTIGSLPIVVKSVGGCGESVARTLTLARAIPSSPSKLVLTDGATVVSKVSAYTQKSTSLTLTATPVLVQGATATSYAWVLPAGVIPVSTHTTGVTLTGSTTIDGVPTPWTINNAYGTTSNTLTVNFSGVETVGVLKFALSVYGVNGAGNSKARTLSVSAAAPATPAIVGSLGNGTSAQFGSCLSKTYTATPIPGATYTWTAPGGTITQTGNVIVVDYSVTSVPLLGTSTVTCFATNGTGSSATKSLTVKRIACTPAKLSDSSANDFKVSAYPNPSSSEFTIESSAKGAMSVKVYDMQGRLVEKSNTDRVGSRLAKGVYNVIVNQGANTKSVRVIKN